jgi:RNA polymerase sigma-70 factor (ECF subfamily)
MGGAVEGPMARSEQGFLERVRAGDQAALGELYRAHSPRVYRFALRRLGDVHEAEDVRQDVFVEVMRSIASFEGRSSVGTWILAIAHHEVASRSRRRHREPLAIDASDAFEHLLASDARIDRRVEALRMLGRCAEALRREVTEPQRVVFELHARGARDIESIALAVGRTRLAVRLSLLRTRRRLAARVAGLREVLSA